MGYSTARNVTQIEMLPELEDLENGRPGSGMPHQPAVAGGSSYATNANYPGAQMLPPAEAERVGRHIRGGHIPPAAAGMELYDQAPGPMPSGPPGPVPMPHYGTPIGQEEELQNVKTFNMPNNSPDCLTIAEHIANCPVCGKLYKNDNTVYIIAIIVLAVVCILLLKKVLDI